MAGLVRYLASGPAAGPGHLGSRGTASWCCSYCKAVRFDSFVVGGLRHEPANALLIATCACVRACGLVSLPALLTQTAVRPS